MRLIVRVLLILLICTASVFAQDPVDVSGDYYKTLLENEYIRVISLDLPVGAEDQPHSHPDALIFYLNNAKVSVLKADGSRINAELKRHAVFFQRATSHQVRNIGNTPVRAISFELIEPVGGEDSVSLAPHEVASSTNSMVFENERVRVTYTVTKPGHVGIMHEHIDMAVYAVTPAKLRITAEGQEPRTINIDAGSVIWSPPVRHTVDNTGESEVILLHVEIK